MPIKLPGPEMTICVSAHVVQGFWISELKALIPNAGMSALLNATSPPVLLLLARIDETSFSVGGVVLLADGG